MTKEPWLYKTAEGAYKAYAVEGTTVTLYDNEVWRPLAEKDIKEMDTDELDFIRFIVTYNNYS